MSEQVLRHLPRRMQIHLRLNKQDPRNLSRAMGEGKVTITTICHLINPSAPHPCYHPDGALLQASYSRTDGKCSHTTVRRMRGSCWSKHRPRVRVHNLCATMSPACLCEQVLYVKESADAHAGLSCWRINRAEMFHSILFMQTAKLSF